MDPSSAVQHHHQEVCSETLESMLVSTKAEMKKPRPPEQTVKCPRCDSINTKFCYYNNYSLSQPRYFCKSCRRYWTQGGTLRNVPVGGGCRKNKRTSSKTTSQDHSINTSPNVNNPLSPLTPFSYDSGDLSLAFARLQKQTSTGHLGIENHIGHFGEHGTGNFLDALRGGFLENAPNGFNHNFYYGVENGEMGMHNYDQEMTTTTATSTVTTVKQEIGREGDNNRVLWGFPWQINGDGNNNMGDFDSTRRIWNGVASWHGLLNTPLM